ncbi:MAG: protein kinase [Acidobacteria bacterium]|nr:protein kinase [Acidobacteriota bacterium]
MTPERYQQIGRLYHDALDLSPDERAAWLDRECAGDRALQREVESLIAADQEAENFIETPALGVAAGMLAKAQADTSNLQPLDTSQPPAMNKTASEPKPSNLKLPRKPLFFWAVVFGGALTLASFLFAIVMLVRYGALVKDFGWQYQTVGDQWVVSEVDPAGVAAGKLETGDQILAINDDPQIARLGADVNLYLKRDLLPPESRYSLRIRRGSEDHLVTLEVPLKRDLRTPARMISEIVVGLAFFVLAMLVGLFKPNERVTQLGFVASLANALAFVPIALFPVSGFLGTMARAIHFLLFCPDVLVAAVSFHFFLLFPPGVPQSKFWTRLKNWYYLISLIQFLPRTVVRLIAASGQNSADKLLFTHAHWLHTYVQLDGAVFGVVALLGIGALCALIARNYRQVTEPGQRRRIKWIIYGAVIGLAPSIIHWIWVLILLTRDPRSFVSPETNLLTQVVMELSAVAIPLTLGFAIFKHRLFDIRLVVRRGVQYLLAKNALRLILFLPVAGLAYAVIANRNLTVSELLFHNSIYFYAIALASLGLRFQKQLRGWVDRKFFREAFDQERILLGLIDGVKALDSMPEISALISRKLESALHPTSIYVFYRDEEDRDLTLGYSSGGALRGLLIPESYKLLRLMESETGALDSLGLNRRGLPAHEQTWLESLGANLIVPIKDANRGLAGLFLLGEKKSEEPYSPDDRRLLQAVAGQVAVVSENMRLKYRVEREQRRAREAMARLSSEHSGLLKECPSCGACYDSTDELCAKDGLELALSLPVERTIDGKYRLEQLLGKGGMGAVYEAADLRLGRRLAVKIMTGSMFGDRTALRRFEREARASAKLNHPNIVTVYDYGGIGDGAYLAMELLSGFTLRAELKRNGLLDPKTAAAWFDQILEGVKAAHAAGIIHRDLKPENVFVCEKKREGGQIKLLDFGLAKLRMIEPSAATSITARGVVMGTFGYMSPEQLTGDEVDERSDLFALGVMSVEALTGNRPFQGRTHAELLYSILNEPFHLNAENREARELNAVLQKCLAKNRDFRFGSVAELQAKLIPAMAACQTLPVSIASGKDSVATQFPTG